MTVDWTMQLSDVLKIVGMGGAAIYVVARIEYTTATLKDAIKSLTEQVKDLAANHNGHNQEVGKIRERLAVIEDRIHARIN